MSSRPAPHADRQAGQVAGAEGGGLGDRATPRPAVAGGVGQRLDERRVGGHPAVDAQRGDREPGVGLGRLDQVGAAVGDALEHGPHDLRPAGAAGEPEQRAARAVVPVGRAEAEQRGHVDDAVGGRRTRRRRRGCAAARRGSRGRRRSHSTLVPADSMIASTPQVTSPPRRPGDDRERAVAGAARRSPDGRSPVHTSSMPPVPNVIFARPGARSPGRSATPAGRRRAGDQRRAGQRGGLADGADGVDDARAASPAGCASGRSTCVVPAAGVGVEQPGDRGVGAVGDVQRAVGQRPGHPRVDRAEAQVAARGSGRSWSSSQATLVADWFGRQGEAVLGARR